MVTSISSLKSFSSPSISTPPSSRSPSPPLSISPSPSAQESSTPPTTTQQPGKYQQILIAKLRLAATEWGFKPSEHFLIQAAIRGCTPAEVEQILIIPSARIARTNAAGVAERALVGREYTIITGPEPASDHLITIIPLGTQNCHARSNNGQGGRLGKMIRELDASSRPAE